MTITCAPEVEQVITPLTETLPERQSGGWRPRPDPRIGLAMSSDDDLLLLENKTLISWVIYHNFHQLGIIDPGELLVFHLCKHGSLQARPCATSDSVEYLIISLNFFINQVFIYKRTMSKEVEIFDMQVL